MKETTRQYYEERILVALNYIQKNLDTPLTLEAVSEVACFSPFHFSRIFGGLVGETLTEHIKRLRLERSVNLLVSSRKPIIEVAFDSCYETPEAYSRAFKKQFGISPSGYRKRPLPSYHRAGGRKSGYNLSMLLPR